MKKVALKSNVTFCLALVLSGGLFGCSSVDHHSANSKRFKPDLYLHLFASYPYPRPPQLILSASVPLSADFDIPMADGQHLKGRIEPRNGNFFVYFRVHLYDGTNVFNEEAELGKRYEPGPQPYDDKVPFIFQPHFVLSANSSPKFFLRKQAAAEKREWRLENPLTARQLAEVKRKFHLMRSGMTEDEVFAMLGLSRYRNLLRLSPFSISNGSNMQGYQLTDGERLILFFDNTGMKTINYQLANGENVTAVDYASDQTKRIVIRAELMTLSWSSNAPPVFQTTSRWP